MFKATVNTHPFAATTDGTGIYLDDRKLDWDVVKISESYFHILLHNKSYRAEVVKIDDPAKTYTLKVNGKIFVVTLKDRIDLLLDQMGLASSVTGKVNNIKAPMPGLIIDLRVKTGDTVAAGDALLILEAMKMENIIRAAGEGVIKSVHVKKGDSVDKNQILIEF